MLAKPAPGFSYEGSGGYDPANRRWIHHGGHDGIPQGFHTFTFDFDTGAWEQKFPPNSPPGVCCVDGGNCFDPGDSSAFLARCSGMAINGAAAKS